MAHPAALDHVHAQARRHRLGAAARSARRARGGEALSGREVEREVRSDVADLLVRYASGIDRRDWALLRSCFTDDCRADYGDVGRWRSGDEITEWMRKTHDPLGRSLHRITNHSFAWDGENVAVRSYVDALVLLADNERGAQSAGFYDDVVVRTGEGWKIARRTFTMVRLQMLG